MPRIYDVSMPIRDGGACYPGNPEIRIEPQQAISKGAGANVSSIAFGSHTGTHVDAVKHFIDDGQTIDEIPLERFVGSATLLAFPDDAMAVTADMLRAHDLSGQRRVLLKTRNSALQSRAEFVKDYTYLAPDGADYLVSIGVQLVGVDYLSVEQFHSGHHKTHRSLLGAGVIIVEGLALLEPPAGSYQFICLPLRLVGLDGAPARAMLIGA
ncbi:MAG: cyclase family protein [Gemmatimonadota bacterium]|nr:cyclase family protein [Gemmatimonadota bacterium]